jgi:hypothetical protein
MKINFSQVLKTRKGEPIRDLNIEGAMTTIAMRLKKPEEQINSIFDTVPILDREKTTFSEVMRVQGEPMTLRDVCCLALDSGIQGESLGYKEKQKLNKMADRIWGALEPIDMKAEDITTLKERIGKIYIGNRIPALACDLLDPDPEPDPAPEKAKKIEN